MTQFLKKFKIIWSRYILMQWQYISNRIIQNFPIMFSLEENKSCAQKPRFNCTNSTRISGFLFLFVIISCSTCIRSYCIKFWKRSDPRLSETTLRLPSEGIPFIEEQLFDPRLSKATHSCVISFCKLLKKRITLTAVRGCILEGRPLRNYQSVRNYFLISLNTFLQLFKIFLFSFSL